MRVTVIDRKCREDTVDWLFGQEIVRDDGPNVLFDGNDAPSVVGANQPRESMSRARAAVVPQANVFHEKSGNRKRGHH